MRALRYTLSVLIAAFLLSGCFTIQILPLTSEMEDIHDTYRREFSARFLPLAPEGTGGNQETLRQASLPGFTHTIEKIRAFQLRHPGKETENAHLTVLEGMIYLQLGLPESAKLMELEVTSAGKKLGSDLDYAPRDRLFANSFGELIKLSKLSKQYYELPAHTPHPAAAFETSAKDIGTALCARLVSYAKPTPQALLCGTRFEDAAMTASPNAATAGAAGDGAPLYLAANTAIAYAWAWKGAEAVCNNAHPSDSGALNVCRNKAKEHYFGAAYNLVRLFLTETETEIPEAELNLIEKGAEGRTRYIKLLRELNKCGNGGACDLSTP